MTRCAVLGCTNNNMKTEGTGIKYYTFPKNEDLWKRWVEACQRSDTFKFQNAKICSKHFSKECFFRSTRQQMLNYCPNRFRNLVQEAVPTKFLPSKETYEDNKENESPNISTNENRIEEMEATPELGAIPEMEATSSILPASDNSLIELEKKLADMEIKMRLLQKENEELKREDTKKSIKVSQLENILKEHYTFGQIKRLMNPKKAVWK